MSNGISITNAQGFTQIDGDYSNYQVIASGTVAGETQVTFTNYGSIPLVMVRPVNFGDYMSVLGDITTSSFKLFCGHQQYYYNQNYEYKVLIPVKSLTGLSGGYGLKVFNSGGDVVFDSGYSTQLKISNVLYFSPTSFSTTATVTTPTSTGKNFFSINSTGLYFVDTSPDDRPVGWDYLAIRHVSENVFTISRTGIIVVAESFSYQKPIVPQPMFFGKFL